MVGKKKLGQVLVEAGCLTHDELEKALVAHIGSTLKLGQFLIKNTYISEAELIHAIATQLHIGRYCPENYPIDPWAGELLPANLSQKYHMVPLQRKGNLLNLAMLDPFDIDAIDIAEDLSRCEVEPVVCSAHELNSLTGSIYGQYINLDGVLESVDDSDIAVERIEDNQVEEIGLSQVQDLADDAPVIRLVNSILFQAVKEGVSDIHIMPEKNVVLVQFRIDGKLHNVPSPAKSMFLPIVCRIKILAEMDITTALVPQDGRFTIRIDKREINVRVSSMPTVFGENIVMRLLDSGSEIYSLELLGMDQYDMDKIRSFINKPYGMILSTGPTGSGKSTSLYSIIKEIYRPEKNIVTLEDPVEYRLNHIRQAQLNRKAGMTFASGLRAILRQDPDVIMLGEIRDSETASIAVQAAMTGHLVLSTVHTNNAAGAITRLINMGIEPFLVSSVMLVSFAQRLIRRVCQHCSEPHEASKSVIEYWNLEQYGELNLRRGRGCVHCRGLGFKGRIGVFETLAVDETVQTMILEGKSERDISRAIESKGDLRPLKDDALRKAVRGDTTLDEAISAIVD